jgi:hypothetical protein
VILGFFTADMNRNMTQWFYSLASGYDSKFFLKPRFLLDAHDELRLEPIPAVDSYDTMLSLVQRPASVLTADDYLPDGRSFLSKITVSFPFSWTVARLTRKILSSLDPARVSLSRSVKRWFYPWWFDSKDGPWPAKVELNARLMRRFAESCHSRGLHCVVLVIPHAYEIESRQMNRRDPVEDVLRPIADEIEMWNPTGYFAEQTTERGGCRYFVRGCVGHYNVDGNALMARYVADRIAVSRSRQAAGR